MTKHYGAFSTYELTERGHTVVETMHYTDGLGRPASWTLETAAWLEPAGWFLERGEDGIRRALSYETGGK